MSSSSLGVGLVIRRLREALAVLGEDDLRGAFREADLDGSGELGANELKAALQGLGFRVSPGELEDVMDFFDTDGSGSVSAGEFVDFVKAARDDGEEEEEGGGGGGGSGGVASTVGKVRAVLMAYGEDALRRVFEHPPGSGALRSLTPPQLGDALRALGVPGLQQREVDALLRRMDEDNDGEVSYEELAGFLRQKAFAEGVRRVMARCAAVLRAQGSSLQKVLEKAARKDARAAAREEARAKGLTGAAAIALATSATTGIPVVTAASLERVLVRKLGFPLTRAQVAAVIGMADMDGSGDCDLEEILYLAGEDFEGYEGGDSDDDGGEGKGAADGPAAGKGGAGGGGGGGGSDSEGSVVSVGLRSPGGRASDVAAAAVAKLGKACNARFFIGGAGGGGGGGSGGSGGDGAGGTAADDAEGADGAAEDDMFGPTDSIESQLYGPLGEVPPPGPGEEPYSTCGRSALDGIPFAALQPGAPTPSAAWASIVDSAFWAMSAAPSAAALAGARGGQPAAASARPLLESSRAHQILGALGIQLPASAVTRLLRALPPSASAGALSGGASVSVSGGGAAAAVPPALDSAAFRALADAAALMVLDAGRAGLPAIAEARVRNALMACAGRSVSGGPGAHGALEDALLTRHSLASALLSVPGAGLTQSEALALAAHAPGAHQPRALAIVHAHIAGNENAADAAENASAGGGKGAQALSSRLSGIAFHGRQQQQQQQQRKGGLMVSSDGTRGAPAGLYPADISVLRLAGAGPDEGGRDPDVSVTRFLTWLRNLAAGGASTLLCAPPDPGADGVEQYPGYISLAFASLDPVARAGATRLCAGGVALPSPISAATLPAPGSPLSAALPHAQAKAQATAAAALAAAAAASSAAGSGLRLQGAGSTGGAFSQQQQEQQQQQYASAFLMMGQRLPASFRPSTLAPLAYAHPWLRLARKTLLDDGWEADPGGMFDRGSGASVALAPGTAAVEAVAQATSNGAAGPPPPTMITHFTTSSGQAADGFGLTLRMASILPGSEEPVAGCLPAPAVPDKSTLLRPLGAVGSASDAPWAGEGSAVRSLPMLLTAVAQVAGAAAIPLPRDEGARSAVMGRVVRVALVDSTPAHEGDELDSPRIRVLSNSIAVPAAWASAAEDVWSFPEPSVSPPTRLVFRSDQPRDGAGPSACLVLFELNLVVSHPFAAAVAATAAGGADAGTSSSSSSSSSSPYTPSRLAPGASSPGADPYAWEEVTCAWGTVPLSALASDKAESTVRVPLTGGAPGAAADILASDILQRRAGLGALAKAVAGAATAPSLSLSVSRLSRLRKSERQTLARLPMTVVTPFGWAPALDAFRRQYASRVLAHASRSHLPAPAASALLPAAAVFVGMAAMPGLGGNPAALSTLTTTVEAEFAARKRASGAPPAGVSPAVAQSMLYEAVLADVVLRAWAVACAEGEGLASAPAGPTAEAAEVAMAGRGTALALLMQAGSVAGATPAVRPVSAAEQLA